ncbi:MAG: DUF6265 family protein [Crocinitomicaceae bacterium]
MNPNITPRKSTRKTCKYGVLLFSIFLCLPSFAQDVVFADSIFSPPKMNISKMGWIEGNWKSSGEKITIQENWSRNGAYSMMAVASIYEQNKIIMFEICTITQEKGTLILRIRHFDSHLKAWEEKDQPKVLPLIKEEKNRIYFHGYTFEKTAKDQLTLYIQSNPSDQLLTIPYVKN